MTIVKDKVEQMIRRVRKTAQTAFSLNIKNRKSLQFRFVKVLHLLITHFKLINLKALYNNHDQKRQILTDYVSFYKVHSKLFLEVLV